MLSEDEFLALCDGLKLSREARELVDRIRKSPPGRAVQSNGKNMTGRYPSRKMRVTMDFESHKVELPRMLELEYDSNVLEYYSQPNSEMKLCYPRNGRNTAARHWPDFFVMYADRAGWEECKRVEDLIIKSSKEPERCRFLFPLL